METVCNSLASRNMIVHDDCCERAKRLGKLALMRVLEVPTLRSSLNERCFGSELDSYFSHCSSSLPPSTLSMSPTPLPLSIVLRREEKNIIVIWMSHNYKEKLSNAIHKRANRVQNHPECLKSHFHKHFRLITCPDGNISGIIFTHPLRFSCMEIKTFSHQDN